MNRRQKKRLLLLTGTLTMVFGAGMVLGTVYAQTMEQEQQEGTAVQELVLPDVLEEETLDYTEALPEEITEGNPPKRRTLSLVTRKRSIRRAWEGTMKKIGH